MVSLRDLVRAAMRMRPDRLIVGECRGVEVVDLLAALNTGHEGSACTVHANTAADVPVRFEALGMLGGLSRSAVQAQVSSALSVVLHLSRAGRLRYLDEIGLLATDKDAVVVRSAWQYLRGPGPAATELGRLLARRGVLVPAVLGGRS